jgi:glycosyltransferase involved in cell wall biosynthesis
MSIPSQEQIQSSWEDFPVPRVSICCTTYNHQDYIEEALKGFLIQTTNFPFEIIIHDDASTDNTLKILNKYKDAYPELIHLITQDTNQYSQGKKIEQFAWFAARGDYIAICEGDDYWISKNKLQIQFDALENANDVDLCFHDHFNLDVSGKLTPSLIHLNRTQTVFGLHEILKSDGSFMATASLMIKAKVLKNLPDWYAATPVSDFFTQALGSLNGALYLPEKICVYRVMAPNSWTYNFKAMSPSELKNYYYAQDKSIEDLGNFLSDEYFKGINYRRFMTDMSAIKNSCFRIKSLSLLFYYIPKSIYSLARYLKS